MSSLKYGNSWKDVYKRQQYELVKKAETILYRRVCEIKPGERISRYRPRKMGQDNHEEMWWSKEGTWKVFCRTETIGRNMERSTCDNSKSYSNLTALRVDRKA